MSLSGGWVEGGRELRSMLYCLLLELASGARDEQRMTGAACALGLAGALTGAPPASLAWRRACPLSKPQATLAASAAAAPALPLLPLNLSHEGGLLALAFLPPPAPAGRCLGVDLQGAARGARALAAAAAAGDAAGEALLRGGSTSSASSPLPTPRALAGAAAAPARLFAARWTLMEAVLKARGQGLAVAGAGAAVLAEAVEEEEEEEEEEQEQGKDEGEGGRGGGAAAGAAALMPALWGARAPAGGWDAASAQRAAAAAAAAATAAAPAPASDCLPALQRVPCTVLARFRGPRWRAVTCALAWPTPDADAVLTFALLDD
jgi:hypothetical protein